ncbi:hypothetical protein EDC32_1011058 [Laceyella sacchari]|jgi:hypothetical protein|nr:hypothetical protein EDC32_1011058 [Laceyella sacchari]
MCYDFNVAAYLLEAQSRSAGRKHSFWLYLDKLYFPLNGGFLINCLFIGYGMVTINK